MITTNPWKLTIIALFALSAIGGTAFSLSAGAVNIGLADIWDALQDPAASYRDVIWNIRFPRTLVAALIGINLSLSGAILQGVMRNPMADPHIIGVSSGAGLVGIAVLILFPSYAYLLTPAAFLGGIGAALVIYLLAWQGGVSPVRVVLAGVAVSAFLNSGISALLTFYSDRVNGALLFMVGGLATRSWPHVTLLTPYTLLGGTLALIGVQRMNVLLLGDAEARSLGLRVEGMRLYLLAVATLLAASSVSVVGMLGFVGLTVPHAARLLIGSDYRFLLPASALLGVTVLTITDTLSRIMFAPVELPSGILMGVLGAPVFLWLLRRRGA
ncbi:corrinoid ABC transporter permease [Paenibacillus tyrfis]|uniref:FecCD family ABC transporter permease n=1 Tax=Paenibacillus tyrfis TaxID=1501230 RepID=UPI0024916948|nr:iron ABC transporter permease [Paenibacillus tyrfis]GLI06859.1 corrinoid ABC transporter permease [Paenibacillus tyrfis]